MSNDYAANCPISRPIKLKGVTITNLFNGMGWSPQVGWMFDVADDEVALEPPPPGAQG